MAQQTVSKMERVQTAVEWLLNYIERENWSLPPDVEELVKKMEKEQITDSYIMGSYDMAAKEFRPEQYYNETYGGQGSPDTSPNTQNK